MGSGTRMHAIETKERSKGRLRIIDQLRKGRNLVRVVLRDKELVGIEVCIATLRRLGLNERVVGLNRFTNGSNFLRLQQRYFAYIFNGCIQLLFDFVELGLKLVALLRRDLTTVFKCVELLVKLEDHLDRKSVV